MLMDMSEYAEPLPTELEQIVDEARRDCGMGPAARPAGTGIADMNDRIRYHTQLLAKLRHQVELNVQRYQTDTKYHWTMERAIAACEHQLKEANERLREYQVQQQGLN